MLATDSRLSHAGQAGQIENVTNGAAIRLACGRARGSTAHCRTHGVSSGVATRPGTQRFAKHRTTGCGPHRVEFPEAPRMKEIASPKVDSHKLLPDSVRCKSSEGSGPGRLIFRFMLKMFCEFERHQYAVINVAVHEQRRAADHV